MGEDLAYQSVTRKLLQKWSEEKGLQRSTAEDGL